MALRLSKSFNWQNYKIYQLFNLGQSPQLKNMTFENYLFDIYKDNIIDVQ